MSQRTARLAVLGCITILASQFASAEVQDKVKTIGGIQVHYKLVLPNGYDPAKAYPAVLAFPGGPQTMPIVESTVARNWRDQAEQRGYIVVVPAAPEEGLYFEGGARVFPEFIVELMKDFKVAGGKFNIAGMSNGGLSAFHIAAMYPQYFISVTGFPGYLIDATDARVNALKGMCIGMHAGELDEDWRDAMEQQADHLRAIGYQVLFTVEKNQPHILATLAGPGAARLFDEFDAARRGACLTN